MQKLSTKTVATKKIATSTLIAMTLSVCQTMTLNATTTDNTVNKKAKKDSICTPLANNEHSKSHCHLDNTFYEFFNGTYATHEPEFKLIEVPYEFADFEIEGLVRVMDNGKYGFIEGSTANVVVPLQFEDAAGFQEGFAVVKKDGKYGFIDKKGMMVIKPIYDYAHSFSEGVAAVQKGGKYGFINKKERIIIPFIYDYAQDFDVELDKNGDIKTDRMNSKGLSAVSMNDRHGYIDKKGKIAIPLQFADASSFNEGFASVKLKDGRYRFINKKGDFISDSYEDAYYFLNGMAQIKNNGKYGFINTKGNLVVDSIYDEASSFYINGLTSVTKDGLYGVIDLKGKVVIPFKYDYINVFNKSLHVEKSGYSFNIDLQGKPIKDFESEDLCFTTKYEQGIGHWVDSVTECGCKKGITNKEKMNSKCDS